MTRPSEIGFPVSDGLRPLQNSPPPPTAEIQTQVFDCFCFKYPLTLLKYPPNPPRTPDNQASGRILGSNRHT